jgi:hypothetical protein
VSLSDLCFSFVSRVTFSLATEKKLQTQARATAVENLGYAFPNWGSPASRECIIAALARIGPPGLSLLLSLPTLSDHHVAKANILSTAAATKAHLALSLPEAVDLISRQLEATLACTKWDANVATLLHHSPQHTPPSTMLHDAKRELCAIHYRRLHLSPRSPGSCLLCTPCSSAYSQHRIIVIVDNVVKTLHVPVVAARYLNPLLDASGV